MLGNVHPDVTRVARGEGQEDEDEEDEDEEDDNDGIALDEFENVLSSQKRLKRLSGSAERAGPPPPCLQRATCSSDNGAGVAGVAREIRQGDELYAAWSPELPSPQASAFGAELLAPFLSLASPPSQADVSGRSDPLDPPLFCGGVDVPSSDPVYDPEFSLRSYMAFLQERRANLPPPLQPLGQARRPSRRGPRTTIAMPAWFHERRKLLRYETP
jgi:hypothetical protein